MKENTVAFRVCIVRPDETEFFRYIRVKSRDSLVKSLKARMTKGQILGWKIYDSGAAEDFYWDFDQKYGSSLVERGGA